MRAGCVLLTLLCSCCFADVATKQYAVGDAVTIKGLVRHPSMNGKEATVSELDNTEQTITIKVHDTNALFRVKPENLELVVAEQTKSDILVKSGATENLAVEARRVTQNTQSNREHVLYVSSLSGIPLILNHWYHKRGEDYDISDDEWKALPSAQQALYVPVEHIADVKQAERENEHNAMKKIVVDIVNNPKREVPIKVEPSHDAPNVMAALEPNNQQLQSFENAVSSGWQHVKDLFSQTPTQSTQQPSQQPAQAQQLGAVPHVTPKQFTDGETVKVESPPQIPEGVVTPKCKEGEWLLPGELCVRDELGHQHVGFKSAISSQALRMGDWYHKEGYNHDITKTEFQQLPRSEQAKYVRIDTPQDIELVLSELRGAHNLGAVSRLAENQAEPPQLYTTNKQNSMFLSDISGKPLKLGRWYHKVGQDMDISSDEWLRLEADEKTKFVRIDTQTDLDRLSAEKWVAEDSVKSDTERAFKEVGHSLENTFTSGADSFSKSFASMVNNQADWWQKAKLNLALRLVGA